MRHKLETSRHLDVLVHIVLEVLDGQPFAVEEHLDALSRGSDVEGPEEIINTGCLIIFWSDALLQVFHRCYIVNNKLTTEKNEKVREKATFLRAGRLYPRPACPC